MSIQPAATVDDLTLVALDFHFTPQCEHSQHRERVVHGGPAAVLVEALPCPRCADPGVVLYLCGPFWEAANVRGVECAACGRVIDNAYRLISVVNR